MKTKKTIFTVLTACLILTVSACLLLKLIPGDPLPTPTDTKLDNHYAYTISNGEATITSVNNTISGTVTIPSALDGVPVTSVGDRAFLWCTDVTSVTIPNSVTSIGTEAFSGCENLTSVTIGNSVTSMGGDMFLGCTALTSITVDDHNTMYSSQDGVLFNKDKTILLCYPADRSAVTYTIPDSVTSIGNDAFSGCARLTSITLPNKVTTMGDHAFSFCDNLTSITIPNSVTSIGGYAFYHCIRLTSITIPDNVTSIEDYAFSYCTDLSSVTIGERVRSIKGSAFSNCINLNSIVIDDNNAAYRVQDGVLFNKDKTTLVCYPAAKPAVTYTIPDSVTSIGNYVFSDCENLTTISLPSSVTTIEEYAFSSCHNLTSVNISNGVTSIGDGAFSHSTALTSVTIPNSVTRIGDHAFFSCSSLTSITIGNRLTSIGRGVFSETGYYKDSTNWDNEALYIGKYLMDTKNTMSGAYTVKPGTKVLADYAFAWDSGLTSVSIPNSVTSIGENAFSDCNDLLTIAAHENNTAYSTQDGVLFNKDKTTLLCYPAGKSATTYTIPDSVTSIGDDAFSCSTGLTSITLSGNVKSIGDGAFYSCENLSSVTIGNTVTSIGYEAFALCPNLSNVRYAGSKADTSNITIADENKPLTSATWHYED